MTETDQIAKEIVQEIAQYGGMESVSRPLRELAEENVRRVLAAYGAAQYEAGAASMRERAANSAYALLADTLGASRPIWRELRALPLREKEG